MNIYQSSKPLPYVYQCIHTSTGQFYYGYRSRNVKLNIPSSSDLGITYFTSSELVKPRFNEFTTIILAEFFCVDDAFEYEQFLICQSWGNPLLLNQQHRYNAKSAFRTPDIIPDITRQKISKALKGRKHSDEHRKKNSEARKGKTQTAESNKKRSETLKAKGMVRSVEFREMIAENNRKRGPRSEETKRKIAESKKNLSDETRQKMSTSAKNKAPASAETRKKISIAGKNRGLVSDETRAKLSAARMGFKFSEESIAKRTETRRINREAKKLALQENTQGGVCA